MEIYDQKINHRVRPIDLSDCSFSFEWKIRTEQENWRQRSYQIQLRDPDEKILWDTGRIEDSRMTGISYEGPELSPDCRYVWKVRSISCRGECAESEDWFETGLMRESDWRGIYIGEQKDFDYHLYRRKFELSEEVQSAKLYLCGLGHYEAFLNGKRVSDRVLEPGWSDYRKTCYYSAYDVTALLQEGMNGIGVKLGDGMYNVPGSPKKDRYVYFERSYGKCKLNVQLRITYKNGSTEYFVTDESWKRTKSPIQYCCIYGGEIFDGRLWDEHFSEGDYDDTGWDAVLPVNPPAGTVTSSQEPPVKVMETYTPVSVTETAPGVFLYDFGKNFSGWVSICVCTNGELAGSRIVLTPGEILDKDSHPDQRVTGHDYRWEYILNDQETQRFRPDFTYTGFRYVQMTGAVPKKKKEKMQSEEAEKYPEIVSMTGEFLYPEVETVGSFSCSNKLFNEIHQIINQAIKSNMKSFFTDCPHREKLPWLEQSHLIGPGIFYNYDVRSIYEKMEQDMLDSQRANGLIPDICPEYVVFGYHEGFVDSPEWGSACIINPWYLYLRYGERHLLEKAYPAMERYAAYLQGRTHHYVLHHGLGDWLDIGPCKPWSQNTPVPVTATCIFYYDLKILEKVSKILGKPDRREYYRDLAAKVYEEYNLQFYDKETGRYSTGSQAAQAMSLICGLVPDKYREKVEAQLREDVTRRHFAVTAGDVGHPFLVAALMKYGMSDLLNQMTNITDTPGYGYQVVHGATTLTEEWDGPEPGSPHGSQNHLMLGGIEEWFYAGLGGLASIREGLPFDEVIIRPHIAEGMTFCDAQTMHPYGKLCMHWEKEEHRIKVQVTIPPNVTARLQSEDGKTDLRVGSGTHVYFVEQEISKFSDG